MRVNPDFQLRVHLRYRMDVPEFSLSPPRLDRSFLPVAAFGGPAMQVRPPLSKKAPSLFAMKTKFLLIVIAGLEGASVCLQAQNASTRGKNADEEWRVVQTLASAPAPSSPSAHTAAAVHANQEQKVQNARQLAQSAKEFRTSFPNHPNAPEARKLEALATLRGVRTNDSAYETLARDTAKAYREDDRIRLADRVEIAMLAERTAVRGKFGGAVFANNGPELELIVDRLRKEFGEKPEVFDQYLAIARTADMNTSRSLAVKLVQSPASPSARAEAQSILDRFSLLGKSPDVPLRLMDGSDARLTQPGDKPTLLFFWPASGPRLSSRFMRALPRDARILHSIPGATTAQVDAARRAARIPGTFCLDAAPSGRAGGELRIQHLPYVVAIDRSGKLAGYGPISATESVLNTINR